MQKIEHKINEADIAYIFGDDYPQDLEAALRNCACDACDKEEGKIMIGYSARMTPGYHLLLTGTCADCGGPIRSLIFNYDKPDSIVRSIEVYKRVRTALLAARELIYFPENTIFEFDIVLNGAKPVIKRKIQISAHASFHELHYVIQFAMGWQHCHLHHFIIDNEIFITVPNEEDWQLIEDSRKHPLQHFFQKTGDTLLYEYDFGDSWYHQITLKKIEKAKPNVSYPMLISGTGACPPEDVGGVHGYAEWIKTYKNPRAPEHWSAREWFGEYFDPKYFDLERVQRYYFTDFKKKMKSWDRKAGWGR